MSLVTGTSSQAIQMQSLPGGGFGFGPGPGGAGSTAGMTGTLVALSQLTSTTLPDYLSRLDDLAEAVVTQVNTLHRTGITAGGNTGVDFFDPAGTTAASISLSAAVQGSTDEIAAGTSGATGDGGLARQLGGLASQRLAALGNETFSGYYSLFVARVGGAVRNATESHATAETLANQASAWRESVSGVSIEEEMVNLVSQQEAYGAAARLVNVADQMVQDVLGLIG
jgi:flagellar hook-associated protein 1 FlgK